MSVEEDVASSRGDNLPIYDWTVSLEQWQQDISGPYEDPSTEVAESVSISGQTTPIASRKGALTPTGTETTEALGTSDPNWVFFSEPEERMVSRIEKLLGRLSQTSRTELLERQFQKDTQNSRPRIGTILFSMYEGESLKSEIPYVDPRRDKQDIPVIAAALSGFSIAANEEQSLFIFPTHQKQTTFDLLADTWMSSSKKTARRVKVDWLELQSEHTRDGSWQHGSWLLKRTGPEYTCPKISASGIDMAKIVFPTSYDSPPNVVVFISGLYCADYKNPLFLAVEPGSITVSSFILRVQCSAPSGSTRAAPSIHALQVTWIAYPSSLAGVHSGSVNTETLRSAAQHVNMGYIPFPVPKFSKAPKVMVGLNRLNFSGRREHNIKAFVSNVTHLGMCWNADSWGETINHGAGISYLAVED